MSDFETMELESHSNPRRHAVEGSHTHTESMARPEEVNFDIVDQDSELKQEDHPVQHWKPSEAELESGMQNYSSVDMSEGGRPTKISSESSGRCLFLVFAMITFSLLVVRNFGQQVVADLISQRPNLSPVSTRENVYGPLDGSMRKVMDSRPNTNRYLGAVSLAAGGTGVDSKSANRRVIVLEGASQYFTASSVSPAAEPSLVFALSPTSSVTFTLGSASTNLVWESGELPGSKVTFANVPLPTDQRIKSIWDVIVVDQELVICVLVESNSTNPITQNLALVGCTLSSVACSATVVKELSAPAPSPSTRDWLAGCRFIAAPLIRSPQRLLSCLTKNGTLHLLTFTLTLKVGSSTVSYDQVQLEGVLVLSPMVSTTAADDERSMMAFALTREQKVLSLTWTDANGFSWRVIADSPFPAGGGTECGSADLNSSALSLYSSELRSSNGEFHWLVMGYQLTVRGTELGGGWNVTLQCTPFWNERVLAIASSGTGSLLLTMDAKLMMPRLWYAQPLDGRSGLNPLGSFIFTTIPMLGLALPNLVMADQLLRLSYEPPGPLHSGSVTVRRPSDGFAFTAPLSIDPVRWGSLEGSLAALWTMAID